MTRTYVINDLKSEEIVASFYEKELKKQIKNILECSREKVINYMLNGKAIIILFNSWIDKKDIL